MTRHACFCHFFVTYEGIDTPECFMLLSRPKAMSASLNQHVLVLNRLWQAVNVCTARRALTLLFRVRPRLLLTPRTAHFALLISTSGAIFPRMPRTMKLFTPFLSAFACRASSCFLFTIACRRK